MKIDRYPNLGDRRRMLLKPAIAECALTRELIFPHAESGTIQIFRAADSNAIAFASQMQGNADGAPDSYHSDNIGTTPIASVGN